MIELLDHRTKSAFLRKSADMDFDQHGFRPWPPAPISRAPVEAVVIDDLARAEHVIRLKCRGRIRDFHSAVDAEFVTGAGLHAGDIRRKPSAWLSAHRLRSVQNELDAIGGGRPQAECRAILGEPRAELPAAHMAPAKASTDRGGALLSAADANSTAACVASAVFSTCRQF